MQSDLDLKELHAPSIKELYVKEIEGLIISGKLPIGAKLPTERELSEKMKVSRAIVNSGLAEVEAKGFLQVIPRKGTFVADYKREGKLDTLISIINYNGGHLDPAMFQSLTKVRTMLEKEAAGQAALNRQERDVTMLKELLRALCKETDPHTMEAIDFRLHHTVCVASGNLVTPLIFYAFINILSSVNTYYYAMMDREESLGYVKQLVRAIEERDPATAIAAVTASFEKGTKIVSEHLFPGHPLYV